MAIDLSKLESPRDSKRGKLLTFFSEPGLGKTTLAATFTSPVFVKAEDGTGVLEKYDHLKDVKVLPRVDKFKDVLDQLSALTTQEHGFKTVVIDSITQMATNIESEIVDGCGEKSINSGNLGYGKGLAEAGEYHRMIRAAVEKLMDKGINVVALGHATTEQLDLPDKEPFSRYTIRMHEKGLKHWVDNADLVGFIKLETHLKTSGDKKKATSTGRRVLVCHSVASNISKNRIGVKEEIILEEAVNPFIKIKTENKEK